MIRFRLALRDLAGPADSADLVPQVFQRWERDPKECSFGSSFIRPFDHRLLSAALLRCAEATAVIVSECIGGKKSAQSARACSAQELTAAIAGAHAHSLDCLTLLISHRDASVTIRAGVWGTAPVYLLANGDELLGDWDPAQLLPHLPDRRPDPSWPSPF